MPDVPADLREPVLVLTVEPEKPRRATDTVAEYHHVIVRAKAAKRGDETAAVQPVSTSTVTLEWQNVFGGKLAGQARVALFKIETFPEAPDIEIIAIRKSGTEEKFTVTRADLVRRKVLNQ